MFSLNTNAENIKSELEEVIKPFGESLEIVHNLTKLKDGEINEITVNGKNYTFTDYFNANDILEEKRLIKRYAKLSMYKALSEFLGKTLPWGALTGIRPTKLAYQAKENNEDIDNFFINQMLVSPEKTNIIKDILKAQEGIYTSDKDGVDFFISIPFCPSKCTYCSFITGDITKTQGYLDDYIEALIKEIDASKPLIKNLRSIYIGGGTPVSIGKENLKKILVAVDKIRDGKNVEYTVEAGRPDVMDNDILDLLKDFNVTRVCLNPQTFNDKTLEIIGRKHTAKDILDRFDYANSLFSVNMDLIAGLPNETEEDFKYSLEETIKLCPDNITVHTLCLKKGSKLKEETERLADSGVSRMIDFAHKRLSEEGYQPYYLYRQKYMAENLENTGYAKKGKACVYNIDVMEEITQNVACGANAISKRVFLSEHRIERYGTPKNIPTYIDKIDEIIKSKAKLFSDEL